MDKLKTTFSLVPLYSYTPKYVTIGTDALHALLGGATGTRMSRQDFAEKAKFAVADCCAAGSRGSYYRSYNIRNRGQEGHNGQTE